MPPDVDAIYQFTVTWSLFGQTCQNVLFFRGKESDTSATLADAVNTLRGQIHSNFVTEVLSRVSHNVELKEERLVTLYPEGGPFVVVDFVGEFGAVTDGALPSYCSAVISWQTGVRGRRTHGRTYLPGIAESYVVGNELTDGALAQMNNIKNQFLTFFGETGASTVAWGVVYSRKNGMTRDPGPPVTDHWSPLAGVPIKYGLARKTIFTQRHRLLGRGI